MPFSLFTTASRIHSTSAVGAWIGVKVTPALAIEGRLSRGRPTLRTVVSGDDELLTTTSAEERLTRYESGCQCHLAPDPGGVPRGPRHAVRRG